MTLKLPTYSPINAKNNFKFWNEAGIKKAYMGFAKLCFIVYVRSNSATIGVIWEKPYMPAHAYISSDQSTTEYFVSMGLLGRKFEKCLVSCRLLDND